MDNKLPKGIGGGSVKKKPVGERLAETFLGGSLKDAKSYVVREVIVPKIKELVYESITGSIDKLINGGNSPKKSNYSSCYSIYTPGTSYTSYSSSTPKISQVFGSGSSRNPAVITLRHKAGADYVLTRMIEELQRYPEGVTVSTYYEACREVLESDGTKSDISKVMSYTDEYYGWTDLGAARVRPHEGGYVVQLPPTIQLR